MLDDGVYTLSYFHKDSVTSSKEIKKGFDKQDSDKEDCGYWKRFWLFKKAVIIDEDCD